MMAALLLTRWAKLTSCASSLNCEYAVYMVAREREAPRLISYIFNTPQIICMICIVNRISANLFRRFKVSFIFGPPSRLRETVGWSYSAMLHSAFVDAQCCPSTRRRALHIAAPSSSESCQRRRYLHQQHSIVKYKCFFSELKYETF